MNNREILRYPVDVLKGFLGVLVGVKWLYSAGIFKDWVVAGEVVIVFLFHR